MADPATIPEIAFWMDSAHAPVCAKIIHSLRGAARIIALGGPRDGDIDQLAHECLCTRDDDPRRMLNDHPVSILIWASASSPSPQAVLTAHEQETRLLLLEPLAGDLAEWSSFLSPHKNTSQGPAAPALAHLPEFMQSPGWLHAADPLETLGGPQSILFTSCGPSDQGSLFHRLMDAWLTLNRLGDMPETIDASLTGPQAVPSNHLRGVFGHMHVHARLAEGRSLVLLASDRAAASQRRLQVLGQNAQLEVTDYSYQLLDLTGHILDQELPSAPTSSDVLELLLEQLGRQVQGPLPQLTARPVDVIAPALACCQASLLSCRTGQPESPRALLRMHLPGYDS